MSSSKKNIKKKKKKNYQTTIVANKRRKKVGTLFSNINFFIIIILLLLLVIVICNTYIVNKNIQKISEEVKRIEEGQTRLENITPHYVFLGDSITERYELSKYFKGYSVVNSGLAGDTTKGILDNMEERVYRYNPSTVFIMIGTNDVNENKSAEYIFNNIKEIVEEIQINLPNANIVVESIIPSQEKWSNSDKNKIRKEVNKLLYNEYKNTDVIYLDLYSILEDKSNQKLDSDYTLDGLHLNDSAYELISIEIKKHMKLK